MFLDSALNMMARAYQANISSALRKYGELGQSARSRRVPAEHLLTFSPASVRSDLFAR